MVNANNRLLGLAISAIPIEPGCRTEFYFSYIQITEHPYDYDSAGMTPEWEPEPCLLGGTLTEVNDTAAGIAIMDGLGSIRVPRRWIFTPVALAVGQQAEFYQLSESSRKKGYPGCVYMMMQAAKGQ